MNNMKKRGDVCTFTAPGGGVVTGLAYLIGSILVVATNTVAATLPFEGVAIGIFTLPKATGIAWTEGEALYWDNSAKKLTPTATNNTLVGCAAAAAASGDATGDVRLPGVVGSGGVGGEGGVQDIVLGTNAPDGVSEFLFVSTTGTVTGAVPNGAAVGQKLRVNQYAVASTPVGTLTGLFKTAAGVAKTTLALGTTAGDIGSFVWDGAAYRLITALGGTGAGLS